MAKLTEEQRVALATRYAAGELAERLGEEYGVAASYAPTLAKRLGLVGRERHKTGPPPRSNPEAWIARLACLIRSEFIDAMAAAEDLGLDKSHLCAQLRAGKFPGAFQWGRRGVWIIPRVAVDGYRATHLNPDRHRRPEQRKAVAQS